jgi:error-prone DNA polymerase
MFVELDVRSNFSFLQGAASPERLVARAAELGLSALALTDVMGLYGSVRAMQAGEEHGVRTLVGATLLVPAPSSLPEGAPPVELLLHVETHAGYRNLCRLLGLAHARHPKSVFREKGVRTGEEDDSPVNVLARSTLAELAAHADGLWCTLLPSPRPAPAFDEALAAALHDAFGPRFSLAVRRLMDGEDARILAGARATSRALGASGRDVPIVATGGVRMASPDEKPILDVLHCIREGTTLDEAGRALLPNAEACLKTEQAARARFPGEDAFFDRAAEIAAACTFSLRELRYRFPCEIGLLEGETPDEALARLVCAGAAQRYPSGVPARVRAQLDRELATIRDLEVAPYFLSVWDVVEIARGKGILCQGRGSAANSAVCYVLGVTAVDPARSSLLFERFLSPERREPPDIDVDFEHERREEVIQAIYEKYGRDRAAMVSEIISYRGKSALREVGKVFGLSLEQVDRLASVVSWWDDLGEAKVPPRDKPWKTEPSLGKQRLARLGLDVDDARLRQVIAMARAIQGFPRHLSIHVGGFVLSAEPLDVIAPVEPATMANRTVVPWDKDDVDALGFFKMDVLGLGMLTAIRKALQMVHDPAAGPFDPIAALGSIPAEDPLVYDALCRADTVGVFQIESRAQMAMLPRLRPRAFYDLVVEVAIVRPGPIQGGMVHPYLRRRNGEEPVDCPHPSLLPILERTLGVPLFQEQVMQIAIVGAGYTGGEADQLRRDMAAWKKNGKLARHEARLRTGFLARGLTEDFAARLYRQIQGFGEYGFPESHAASFALLVYASSWLKVHHPAAFAAALINSQPMGFYSAGTILEDARRHGVRTVPLCATKSAWDCTLEDGAIRAGLRMVKGLGEDAGRRVVAAREASPFTGTEDVAARAKLGKKELDALAEAGAFDVFFDGSRRSAMWAASAPAPAPLFAGAAHEEPRPLLAPLARAEQLVLDFERTGTSRTGDHPMRVVRPRLPRGVLTSRELAHARDGTLVRTAGMVICRQRPGTASGVVFMTLEDELGFVNLVLWARVFEELRHVATSSPLLLVHGKVQIGDAPPPAHERSARASQGPLLDDGAPRLARTDGSDVVHVIVSRLERLSLDVRRAARVPPMSRDFH